jgi:hypothetical protein
MAKNELAPLFVPQPREALFQRLCQMQPPESSDDKAFITADTIALARQLFENTRAQAARGRSLGLFGTSDVIVVPGFLGSSLTDATGGNGLIWIDPTLALHSSQLTALRLDKFDSNRVEREAAPEVRIESRGAIPVVYDLLRATLEVSGHNTTVFPVDWRKNLEESATQLTALIRDRQTRRFRPLHIVAHSQGSLVARRALQLLGPTTTRQLVANLVLIGPASFGTFAAAFAIAGNVDLLETIQMLGIKFPADLNTTLQSFTGLYQLLPWKSGTVSPHFDLDGLHKPSFWQTNVDAARLAFGLEWAQKVDSVFFNDRTTIILGDQPTPTVVAFDAKKRLVATETAQGDGTVLDSCALLPGVRAYRAPRGVHGRLPMDPTVISAVRGILRGNLPSSDTQVQLAKQKDAPILLKKVVLPGSARAAAKKGAAKPKSPAAQSGAVPSVAGATEAVLVAAPPVPTSRKLRVFSFDPLLATHIETLEIAEIAIDIPWEEESLKPGPVGEYIEVVDYDPASNCFYRPVDLSHPRLVADQGLAPAESNPQFHQQMVYAVSMATIHTFEQALGRSAQWAPRLIRDENGEVIPTPTESQFVPRLRIYPHAMREANAFYDPERHSLLFGYFPSREQPGGETLPGGTVFTCQSFDIVAHETTHALLHGLHRYYLDASNPDLFAFHEAFADAVALFQHFGHRDVVREQIARSRGSLKEGSLLGELAQQFGQAMGHRGGLRKYIGERGEDGVWREIKPDPSLYQTVTEPHDRGAILMAAIFRAFLNIYTHRVKDLFRIATGGTGKLPDGEIHPDLVNRLADEAVKSASHLLRMCVRALDYVPPVDLTFGEYLRALITADYDLIRNDDRNYRVAVIDAFRSWGLYPADVNVLDESALHWRPPVHGPTASVQEAINTLPFREWVRGIDRRDIFLKMESNCAHLHSWLKKNARTIDDNGHSLGLFLAGEHHQSIARDKDGAPKFQIHSVRPCSRIGPNGEQRIDLVAEIVQRRAGYLDTEIQDKVDRAKSPWAFSKTEAKRLDRKLAPHPDFWFRGGCTLIINPDSGAIRYAVAKSVCSDNRLIRQRDFETTGAVPSLAATYYDGWRNPFALLHNEE